MLEAAESFGREHCSVTPKRVVSLGWHKKKVDWDGLKQHRGLEREWKKSFKEIGNSNQMLWEPGKVFLWFR